MDNEVAVLSVAAMKRPRDRCGGIAIFDMDKTITNLCLGDTLDDHWYADKKMRPADQEVPTTGQAFWEVYLSLYGPKRFEFLQENFDKIREIIMTPNNGESTAEEYVSHLTAFFLRLKEEHKMKLVVLSVNVAPGERCCLLMICVHVCNCVCRLPVTRFFINQCFPGVFDEVLGWEDLETGLPLNTEGKANRKRLKIDALMQEFEQDAGHESPCTFFVDDSPTYCKLVGQGTQKHVETFLVPLLEKDPTFPQWEANGDNRFSNRFIGGMTVESQVTQEILAYVVKSSSPAPPM